MTRLLEGSVLDPKDTQIANLERENERLQRELRRAQEDAGIAEQQAAQAVAALRRQLSPLYRALQAVFGEMDAIAPGDESGPSSAAVHGVSARVAAILADWKAKNPASDGKMIDALVLHDSLSVQQMRQICKMGPDAIYAATSRLRRGGIITKNGGRFSLAVK